MGNAFLRLKKIIYGVRHPVARRALRHGVGASVEHVEALAALDFDSVVDVGANRGQFATFARSQFPSCRIISFEPLQEPAAIFELLFRDDPKTRLVRSALSSISGHLTIHVTKADDSSSPLPVGREQYVAFGSTVVEKRTLPCARLSDVIGDDDLGALNLLKIDTQGFELEVLKGGRDLLPRFAAIYCEISFKELYTGQALASDVVAYLSDCGFGLAGIYNLISGWDSRPIQADALFIKK